MIDLNKIDEFLAVFERNDFKYVPVKSKELREVITLIRKQESELKAAQAAPTGGSAEKWAEAWHALRDDVLSGVDGFDNDQVNTVLGMLDNYEPAAEAHPLPAEQGAAPAAMKPMMYADTLGGVVVEVSAAPQQHAQAAQLCNRCVGYKVIRVSDDSPDTKPCPDCSVPGNAQAALSDDLPPLPEMEGLQDIPYALNTPDDWDADYRYTWVKLQVAERNKMQWRAYALKLRAILAARQPEPLESNGGPEFTVDDPDLNALLNAAVDWKFTSQNMDTGLHMMSLVERVEDRLKVAPVAAAAQGEVLSQHTEQGFDKRAAMKCHVNEFSSRVCERGTRSCHISHGDTKYASEFQQGRAAGIEEAANKLQSLSDDSASDWATLYFAEAAAAARALTNQGG